MNRLELFRLLRRNVKLSEKRSPALEQSMVAKVMMYIGAALMGAYMIFLGSLLGKMAAEDDEPALILIVLPILLPCLLATGVYIFMQSWNEYTFAVLFTNDKNRTIPVALKMLVGSFGVQWDLITAGGIITIIPVCIMFFFAQKRLVSGLTAGAVKG